MVFSSVSAYTTGGHIMWNNMHCLQNCTLVLCAAMCASLPIKYSERVRNIGDCSKVHNLSERLGSVEWDKWAGGAPDTQIYLLALVMKEDSDLICTIQHMTLCHTWRRALQRIKLGTTTCLVFAKPGRQVWYSRTCYKRNYCEVVHKKLSGLTKPQWQKDCKRLGLKYSHESLYLRTFQYFKWEHKGKGGPVSRFWANKDSNLIY